MSVKTFVDIFSPFLGDMKKIGYKTDVTIGQRALEKIEKSPTMGLESMGVGEVEKSVRKNCAEFVMACESALSDLQRYNSVSLALAVKHREVIGIEPNTANFTTQFSKKNYDMAVENLKGFLLIGASVAIAAGLGWLVYKMLTAKKEKGANGKPLKEISKEVTKASELFAAIDLTNLPKDVQDKYLELAKADANEMVKRVATDDHYLKDGFLLELSSICHDASFTNLEAMCFGREDGTWLVNFYNRHHDTFIKNIKDLIEVVEGVRNGIKGLDVTNIDIAVIEGRIDNAYHERQKDLDSLMRVIDLEGNGLEFEDIAEHLTRDPSFGPIEFVKRASKETVVASVKEFDTFNKAKDEVAKLGGELDKLTKDLEKLKSSVGDRMPNFDNGQVIEKLKVEVSEMEHIRNYVVRETSALAQTYKYIVTAAKRYASRINTVIEDLVDEGMKKDYRAKIKKAAEALPNRRVATESIDGHDSTDTLVGVGYDAEHDEEAEQFLALPEYQQAGYRFDPREGVEGANIMAMESWSMGAKVAIGIAAAVAILGIGALIASTLIKRSATADERHSGKEQDKQALNNAEVIERQIAEIDSRWKAIRGKVNSIEGFNKRYPDFEQTAQDVETRLRRLNNKTVDVNGVEVPAMQEVLESFGDKRGVMVRALLSTHLGKVTSPYCLSGVYNKYSAAITSYHRELVVKVLEMLREGRDPEAIIDYMERWYRGPEIKLMRDAMVESTRTLGEQQGQVDAYWLTATTIEYDTENYHRSQPMTVMSAASKSSENFSPIVKQLKDHLEQFTLPEDLVKQYEKSEAESKGTRDKVASILNRLAEFKPLFAQYVRVIRYELELIEELMGVKDRLLKAFTRYYRDNASELKDLHIKVADIEDQEWFKE